MYDQHGREWNCQVGNKTGKPTGLLTPNFRAPWYPDQQYLKVNPDNTAEMYIDYDALLLRRNARLTEFHKIAVDFARDNKLAVPTRKGEYTEDLKRAVGGAPKPIQPIVAAMQGNVYILGEDYAELIGKPYIVDPRLESYVVKQRNEAILDEFDFAPSGDSFGDVRSRNAKRAAELAANTESAKASDEPIDTLEDDLEAFAELGAGDEATEVDAMLEELEEEHDAEALGGRTVPPQKSDHVARQAPRRPGTKTAHKGAKHPRTAAEKRRAAQRGNRPTLATGAKPVISGGL
jgi:hypothetical protein